MSAPPMVTLTGYGGEEGVMGNRLDNATRGPVPRGVVRPVDEWVNAGKF